MNSSWQDQEARLWNSVMCPRRRKLTTHSIPKTERKRLRKLLEAIDKQREREFTDGWNNLQAFLVH